MMSDETKILKGLAGLKAEAARCQSLRDMWEVLQAEDIAGLARAIGVKRDELKRVELEVDVSRNEVRGASEQVAHAQASAADLVAKAQDRAHDILAKARTEAANMTVETAQRIADEAKKQKDAARNARIEALLAQFSLEG